MRMKIAILGTLAYTLATFPLAVLWHVVLFESRYQAFGYFDGEPSFALGFLSIVVQGLVMSLLFPLLQFTGNEIVRGLKFAALMGVFLWTSHVIALMAKQTIVNPGGFLVMESAYLALQFLVFGLLIGMIQKKFG